MASRAEAVAAASPPGRAIPALAAMAGAGVSVQMGAALAKSLFPVVGAQGAVALRVGLGALILIAVLRPWRRPPPRRAWIVLAGYGASLGLMNLLFYAALQTIPLGVAVGLALLPLWRQAHPLDPVGVALALGAGLCWGLYIVLGQKAGAAHGAQATAVGMVFAALVAVPFGAVHAGAGLLSPVVLLPGVAVAILSSVLPYSLEMFALSRIPVRVFGTLMSVEPAIAAAVGWVLLHETLTLRQGAAIAAIMLASVGVTLGMREPRAVT